MKVLTWAEKPEFYQQEINIMPKSRNAEFDKVYLWHFYKLLMIIIHLFQTSTPLN